MALSVTGTAQQLCSTRQGILPKRPGQIWQSVVTQGQKLGQQGSFRQCPLGTATQPFTLWVRLFGSRPVRVCVCARVCVCVCVCGVSDRDWCDFCTIKQCASFFSGGRALACAAAVYHAWSMTLCSVMLLDLTP